MPIYTSHFFQYIFFTAWGHVSSAILPSFCFLETVTGGETGSVVVDAIRTGFLCFFSSQATTEIWPFWKVTESPLFIKKSFFVFSRHSTFLPLSFLAAGHKFWGRPLRLLRIVRQPKVPLLRSSSNNGILVK